MFREGNMNFVTQKLHPGDVSGGVPGKWRSAQVMHQASISVSRNEALDQPVLDCWTTDCINGINDLHHSPNERSPHEFSFDPRPCDCREVCSCKGCISTHSETRRQAADPARGQTCEEGRSKGAREGGRTQGNRQSPKGAKILGCQACVAQGRCPSIATTRTGEARQDTQGPACTGQFHHA